MTASTSDLTDTDYHHLAAVALAEQKCRRDGCSCTGVMSELHAKVDAYCARSLADSIERARECEALGHRFPAYVPDRWMQRRATCSHCGAVAQ